jgi:hypothetical protein
MLVYLGLTLLILLVSCWLYIRFRFRFWSQQPVFHIYNLWAWIYPYGLVQHAQPPMTKFYDTTVNHCQFGELSAEKKELFYHLINGHFMPHKREQYSPTRKAVFDYLKGHAAPVWISLLFDSQILADKGVNGLDTTRRLIGAMTSRPIDMLLYDKPLSVSYVDYLCVHKSQRKKGVAPRVIYSHYRNSRMKNSRDVFLFKREGTVNFMVPLTAYMAYCFPTKYLNKPNFMIPNNISCHLVNGGNFELFAHYVRIIRDNFPCSAFPSMSNLKQLVESRLLLITLIMDANEVVGCYVFRDPHTTYSGGRSLEAIASCFSPGYQELLVECFSNALVLASREMSYIYVVIENISNNGHILKNVMRRCSSLWESPMAYYLYNFIYRPFLSSNVFLLN